jgi:phenylalanyl-tRNA synthetase beta chain
MLLSGPAEENSWLRSGVTTGYFLVKGLVERLAAGQHCPLEFLRPGEESAPAEPFLHPGKSAVVALVGGPEAGWVGEIHPLVVQAYDLKGPAAAAELDLAVLIQGAAEVLKFRDLLAFPAVEQDLALVVDAAVPAAAVVASLRAGGGGLLEEIRIFDVYEGPQIPAGKKSLALRVSFRAAERTLSEAEVNELRREMLARVRAELGVELRA